MRILLALAFLLTACASTLPVSEDTPLKCKAELATGIAAVEQKYGIYEQLSDGTQYGKLTGWYFGTGGVSGFGPSKSGVTDSKGIAWSDARAQEIRTNSLDVRAICEIIGGVK